MAATGLINRYSRTIIASALRKGYELETICEAAGVSSEVYEADKALFGPEDLSNISRYVKRLMDDEFCGLTRRHCKAGTLALACELILPSSDLQEALDKAFRFYALVNDDIQFDLTAEDELADIRVHVMEPALDPASYLPEWFLLLWRSLSSWLIGEEIPILKTRFSHQAQGVVEEYKQVFASDCAFAQPENSISFHGGYLRKPISRTLEDLKAFYATSSIDLINFSGVDYSLKSRVRSVLKNYFFDTQRFYPMQAIARKFNLSEQSLRRRLDEEGSSYRAIKEDIRREAAINWLLDDRIPISEVSRMPLPGNEILGGHVSFCLSPKHFRRWKLTPLPSIHASLRIS
jgi:AraC-like DNA-binding protein